MKRALEESGANETARRRGAQEGLSWWTSSLLGIDPGKTIAAPRVERRHLGHSDSSGVLDAGEHPDSAHVDGMVTRHGGERAGLVDPVAAQARFNAFMASPPPWANAGGSNARATCETAISSHAVASGAAAGAHTFETGDSRAYCDGDAERAFHGERGSAVAAAAGAEPASTRGSGVAYDRANPHIDRV